MNYICLNGEILPKKHAQLSFDNRAFRFGEAIVEEMRSSGIRVPFFADHFERLTKALRVLGISYLSAFTAESLLRSIELLIHRNKCFNINKLSLTLWREDDKELISDKTGVNYLIEVTPLKEKSFILNERGLISDIFLGIYKSRDYLSPYHTTNNLFKLQAFRYAREHKIEACLITNPEGQIIEEADSNIFFASGKTIYTTSIESGCVDGVMRKQILAMAKKDGFIIKEEEPQLPSFIYEVEEIFLANDVYGIRWVGGFRNKRYRKKRCIDFVYQLNQIFQS